MSSVFRFAPSPNGFLHPGHAYSALLNARMAADAGGTFLLRLEDIDTARCTRAFVDATGEDLAWLGLTWPEPVRRQSEHFADYHATQDRLRADGLLYPCFCTRGDIARAVAGCTDWPRDPDGSPLYPGTCRALSRSEAADRALHEPHALRLNTAVADTRAGPLVWTETGGGAPASIVADPQAWGDVILVRKDIGTSYHLAVTVDDAHQGVTDVVRGKDLFAATAIHRLLQALLHLPTPRYHHHPLLRDGTGAKLAKSRLSTPLRTLRAEGVTPAAIRTALGF